MLQDDNSFSTRLNRFEGNGITANRFEELSRTRVERRKQWEASQLANPTEFIGTCLEMCPEYERHEREAHYDVAGFEKVQIGETAKIDHKRAVKKYHRPAAGNEAPLPEDVRPPPILRQTMDYLLDEILDKNISFFSDKHKFVRDRTRSIRQDIIVQQRSINSNIDSLLTIVKLHEEIARFHIISGHRLCGLEFSEFDPFQNTEQLRKVLQSLQEYYIDIRKNYIQKGIIDPRLLKALENESEFRSYQLITHAEDRDVFRQALSFPDEIFNSEIVQISLKCISAYHQTDYIKYFNLTKSAPYLLACLLHEHFAKLRSKALQVIIKVYLSKEPLPVESLLRWLFIEDINEFLAIVKPLGGSTTEISGNLFVSFNGLGPAGVGTGTFMSMSDVDPLNQGNEPLFPDPSTASSSPTTTNVAAKMSDTIEAKVQSLPISSLIRGVILNVNPNVAQVNPMVNPQNVINTRKIDEMTTLLRDNLLQWFVFKESINICTDLINQAKLSRQILKGKVISALSTKVFDSFLREFVSDMSLVLYKGSRATAELFKYRDIVLSQISETFTNNLIAEVVKGHCRNLFRDINSPKVASGLDSHPILPTIESGFSTPLPVSKRARKSKTIFDTAANEIRIQPISDLFLNITSMTERINDLSQMTSQELIETCKFEDHLNSIIKMNP